MKTIVGISVALLLALGACSDASESGESGEPQARTQTESKGQDEDDSLPEVDWSAHSPDQKKIIDQAAREKDCALLQGTFDVQANKDGVDPDILAYIDEQLKAADCY